MDEIGGVTLDFSAITVEKWLRGPLQVVNSDAAHANKKILDAHLQAEWTSDLDGTMRTMHPDGPWQIVHGLGVEVRGFDQVRDYYAARFESWTGPGLQYFTRATIADSCGYLEGQLSLAPGGDFAGHPARGRTLDAPSIIVLDFRDGLLQGETVYLDSDLVRRQLDGGIE